MTSLLKRPVDPGTQAIIREIKNATLALGVDTYLVGAMARTILLEHV